jgi:hypothetical protein
MSRLGAKATGWRLRLIRGGEEEIDEPDLTNDDTDDCELRGDSSTTATVSTPALQPSLRVGGAGKKRALPTEVGGPNKKYSLTPHGLDSGTEPLANSCGRCVSFHLKVLSSIY